jgi:hypothetical protein
VWSSAARAYSCNEWCLRLLALAADDDEVRCSNTAGPCSVSGVSCGVSLMLVQTAIHRRVLQAASWQQHTTHPSVLQCVLGEPTGHTRVCACVWSGVWPRWQSQVCVWHGEAVA